MSAIGLKKIRLCERCLSEKYAATVWVVAANLLAPRDMLVGKKLYNLHSKMCEDHMDPEYHKQWKIGR